MHRRSFVPFVGGWGFFFNALISFWALREKKWKNSIYSMAQHTSGDFSWKKYTCSGPIWIVTQIPLELDDLNPLISFEKAISAQANV
ncbi:hypothetical protein [Paenibacillus silagei]|uniref:Uncharacterized protein n=1 Tax=Paenibacillus silagei TaxID=1670801 RepID=A0ABS4NNT9_9BACL|nr:hypothetical protein [Paenibacillus silagei]MBP2111721.1 hypothetical protein [Paenibacillus silagei]